MNLLNKSIIVSNSMYNKKKFRINTIKGRFMKNIVLHIFICLAIIALLLQTSPIKAFPLSESIDEEPQPLDSHKDPLEVKGIHDCNLIQLPDELILDEGKLSLIQSEPREYIDLQEDLHKPAVERVYIPPTPEQLALTKAQVESFSCAAVTDVPQIECEALVALYNSTNGAGWGNNTNWLLTTTVDDWFGITVSEMHVSQISFIYNYLVGTIPTEIGNLTYLSSLNLSHNQLSGVIPPQIGNLLNLTELELSLNQLSGTIPSEIGYLSNLESLYLYSNLLSGSIPSDLGNLTNLTHLYLSDNQLSGSIPSQLGNLVSLLRLSLSYNQLSGNIPSELSNIPNLYGIHLSDNQLTGNIPAEFGNLSNLRYLVLEINQLSGDIPLSLVNLVLTRFTFNDTLLCEPNNPVFLAWKETIYIWKGTGIICEMPSWLLMYYMAGDNNLDEHLQSEINDIFPTRNSNIDLAIFYDSTVMNTSYRFYPANGGLDYIHQGNLNSGDDQTLSDFMVWAKAKSTASNQALIVADHGHGLSGVAVDDREGEDDISVKELQQALMSAGSVDVLFSHTCLTGNLEFMWELRGLTDYYVASESQVWLPMDHNYLREIDQDTTAEVLAVNMAESYFESYNSEETPSTISVLSMAFLQEMFNATNNLALAIKNASLQTKYDVWWYLGDSVVQRFDERFPDGISALDRLADIFHFSLLVNNLPELSIAATALLDLEDDFVIFNRAWSGEKFDDHVYWDHSNARGVSISLPMNPISFYDGEWLDLATGADWSFVNPNAQSSIQTDGYNWGPMISDLVFLNNPDGDDDPLPPDLVAPGILYSIYLPIVIH